MKKKILITGGGGFIGYHLAKKLQNNGHEICLVDNFSRGKLDLDLKKLLKLKNINMLNILYKKKSLILDLNHVLEDNQRLKISQNTNYQSYFIGSKHL